MTEFKDINSLEMSESKLFEAFGAFTLATLYSSDAVEPETLVYEGDDPGIDSALIFVNERYICTMEELKSIFEGKKSDNEVNIVFTQAKTSERWEKKELNNFESAVLDFISESPEHKLAEHLIERKEIFDSIVTNLGKVKDGKPKIHCYLITSASENAAVEIENARKTFCKRLESTGLFLSFDVTLLGRDRLVEVYRSATGAYEAKFAIIGSASFPRSEGIQESYVVTVQAKALISAVLKDASGNLRRTVFEENVRDFIDLESSAINLAMRRSLLDSKCAGRFGILNNGITIISPDVRLQSNEMFISNYQIVNGCQTSNVIFGELENVAPETTLMVKIVETADQEIVDEIVESTNSQNKIEDHQFLARMDCVKAIERYFKVRCEDNGQILYFERRPNQYNNQGLPAVRIFTIKELARCCGAMFFDRPDLSARYPAQLVEELSATVFDKENKEEIFFASAFAYYRLKLLQSNQNVDPIVNKFKWHSLMALKYFLVNGNTPSVKSSKIEDVCKKVVDFSSKSVQQNADVWDIIANILKSLNISGRDDLRRTRLNAELKQAVLESRVEAAAPAMNRTKR